MLPIGQKPTPSEGREAVDREVITLEPSQEELVKMLAANPNTIVVLVSSFPMLSTGHRRMYRVHIHHTKQSGTRECIGRRYLR
ncbi:MAG: hypothetical protein U0T82_04265 [Bacteroidales bacterium]